MILVCVTAGCATGLRPDQSAPAAASNYDTAEIVACAERWHGLGVCSATQGSQISSLDIGVQGYYGGTVQWYSEGCGINYAQEYSGNVVVPLKKEGVIPRSCIISVTVTPKFDPKMRGTLAVHSFRGHLAVKLLPSGGGWLGETRKLSGNWQDNLTVPVQGWTAATVVLRGCKKTFIQPMGPVPGELKIPLQQAIGVSRGELCLLDGFAVTHTNDQLNISVLTHIYNSEFTRLSLPMLNIEGSTLVVEAEDAVSIIALDDNYQLGNKVKFRNFEELFPHYLRLLTVKGRSVLCKYTPVATTPPPGPKGKWECRQ